MVLRAIVAMVAALSLLATASPAEATSLEDCGQRVIRDWYSGGRVDKQYPLPCYRAAIRSLPDDVLQYTDAGSAIERALERARHGRTGATPNATAAEERPPATTSSPAATPARKAKTNSAGPRAKRADTPARLASGPAHHAGASGIPYPLIALGALSAVLLVSGVAAGLARRHR
jgi:hypothetical protein